MTPHLKVYLEYFDLIESDLYCERCGAKASQIHHINGRGKDKDVIENLIALCRDCHNHAHASKEYVSKQEFQRIHDNFLKRHK
jgi:5-methylcytosine-specific restriction endonuclease McrA